MSLVLRRGVLIAVLLVSGLALAEDDAKEGASAPSAFPALYWLRDTLAEFSTVAFPWPGGGTKEVVTTRTQGLSSADTLVLTYERVTYAKGDATEIDGRQLIVYNIEPASLDAGSVTTRRQGPIGAGDDPVFWIVTVAVLESPGFVPYDNFFESRKGDGTPELTRSRGRVREIALGYFPREDVASRVAVQFREYLRALPRVPHPEATPKNPEPGVKDSTQSDA